MACLSALVWDKGLGLNVDSDEPLDLESVSEADIGPFCKDLMSVSKRLSAPPESTANGTLIR